MKKLATSFTLLLIILFFSSYNRMERELSISTNSISVLSYAPFVPVLKGKELNPFLRLAVTVPTRNEILNVKELRCTINQGGLSQVLAIEIYRTTTDLFSNTQLITSFCPDDTEFVIPVDVSMNPGTHFFWLSVRLKPTATAGAVVALRCTKIIDANRKQTAVRLDNSVYEKYVGVAIRKAGDEGVHTYRIPGIVRTNTGALIAVYDIRYNNSGDLPGNIDVGMSRSTDNGTTWEPMRVIMDMGAPHDNNGVGDPAVLYDPATSKIIVAALWSKGNRSIAGSLPGISPDSTGQFVLSTSADDGHTWSAPYTIAPQVKNPAWHLFFQGPGSGIAMQNGTLVFPAQYWDENKMPYSTLIYSDDHGLSWKGKINGPKSNTTESQVVETTPGTLMLNMRDNRGSYRSVATTTNFGASWVTHETSYSSLINPVCMGSLIKARVKLGGVLKDILFFSNPNTSSGRYNMTIKGSTDLGENWLPVNQLLVDERTCFGYSNLVQIDAETIGILYEGRGDLYFVKYPVAAILKSN